MTSHLEEARDVVRARAVEDFAFFSGAVLGVRLDPSVCVAVQHFVEKGEPVQLNERHERALDAWLVVIGRRAKLAVAPTETFAWLFAEHVE